jgi:hypothetical protein
MLLRSDWHRTLALALGLLLASAAPAWSADMDWAALADGDTVEVLTTDADGDARETTIWVVVLDGVGYIRSSKSSTWGDNVERNPEIALRAAGSDYPVRAAAVEDEAEIARIVAGFEAKYGSNPILNWIRGEPRIWQLAPR